MILTFAVATLVRVVYSAFLASVGVTTAFALAVLGAVRAGELRRSGRGTAGLMYAALSSVALVVCAGAVVAGVILVGHK